MIITAPEYHYMSKKEYANRLDISVRTLRYWLNGRYYEEMKEIGYTKLQKKLTPKQVTYLDKKLVYRE